MAYSRIFRNRITLPAFFGAVLAVLSGQACAAPITFDVTFYGDTTDDILATGVIVIDDSLLVVGQPVTFHDQDYLNGLIEAHITVPGGEYLAGAASGLYLPIIEDGVLTLGQSGLREITWESPGGSFPLLTPNKPVLPPPVVGQTDPNDDGSGSGSTDYVLGQNWPIMTIYIFSDAWAMSKGPWSLDGGSSSFVERPIPEPASMTILGLGLFAVTRRRNRSAS